MLSDRINGSGMRTRLETGDWSVAALVAGAVTMLYTLWPYPMPHLCVWNEIAAAASLQPPVSAFPGVSRLLSRMFFDTLGAESGLAATTMAGHLLAGATAGLWHIVFRQILEFSSLLDMADHTWNRRICPALSAAGALSFAFSAPVWTSFQTVTPAGCDLFLAALAFAVLFRFIARGRHQTCFLAFFLVGALFAETPLGALALAATAVLFFLAWRMLDYPEDIEPVIRFPLREEYPWLLTVSALLAGFGLVVMMNDTSFSAAGGAAAGVSEMYGAWKGLLAEGTTAKGACLGFAANVLPLALMVWMFPRMTHPAARKPVWTVILCISAGAAAAAQLSGCDFLRYRVWADKTEDVAVSILPGLMMAASSATLVLSSAALSAMAWCHEPQCPVPLAKLGGISVAVAVAASVGLAGYGRQCKDTREKLGRVAAHIDSFLEENKDRDSVPSRGKLDAMLKLRARCLGRNISIAGDGE